MTKTRILKIAQIAALASVVILTAVFWPELRNLSVDELVGFTCSNIWLAATLFIVFYILKSFIIVMPVLVLQIAVGIVFPVPAALLINLSGMVITLFISYYLGRFTGRAYVEKLIGRYPKASAVKDIPSKNEFVFCFLTHSMCLFPMNIIGMLAGSVDIDCRKYICGAFCGSFIRVVSVTLIGVSAMNPSSPVFILSVAVTAAVSIASFLMYYFRRRHSDDSAEEK